MSQQSVTFGSSAPSSSEDDDGDTNDNDDDATTTTTMTTMWICSVCTLLNDNPMGLACTLCGTERKCLSPSISAAAAVAPATNENTAKNNSKHKIIHASSFPASTSSTSILASKEIIYLDISSDSDDNEEEDDVECYDLCDCSEEDDNNDDNDPLSTDRKPAGVDSHIDTATQPLSLCTTTGRTTQKIIQNPYKRQRTSPSSSLFTIESNDADFVATANRCFRQYWTNKSNNNHNHNSQLSLRPFQLSTIRALQRGRDCLVISGTGSGKSLCFQLPPLLLEGGVAVVISPLISLMRDQCESLSTKGVTAEYLGSGQSDPDAETRAFSGRCSIIYCCPETLSRLGPKLMQLRNTLFARQQHQQQQVIKTEDDSNDSQQRRLPLPPPMILAIDECHCVSKWGNDFRKHYLNIGRIREEFLPNVPCVALTATATPRVREDVCSLLKLSTGDKLSVFIESFDRPNLHYSVAHCPMTKKNNMEIVVNKILKLMRPNIIQQRRAVLLQRGNTETVGPSAIVYCTTRKDCEVLATALNIALKKAVGWRVGATAVEPYHAGLPQKQRGDTQIRWTRGSTIVVCATIAFGMGIDKANVRLVVHYGWPQSIEAYHQESGRAGRDGLPAQCVLLAPMHTVPTLLPSPGRSVAMAHTLKSMLRDMNDYGLFNNDTTTHLCCRRRTILRYFGQNLDDHQEVEDNDRPCCDLCDRRLFLSQQRAVLEPLCAREQRHHHNINNVFANNNSILPTKREPILNQTLHLLKFLIANGADRLENGIGLYAHSLETLITATTEISPSSSWKWWRGLCRMLVREGWLERGTITTNYMTRATAAGGGGRRRKKRSKKRTTKRNDGVATVMREATKNTEVVFVTSLGKELLLATQQEARSVSTTPSLLATQMKSKIFLAINTKMSCYHDLDMAQTMIDYPSYSTHTTNTDAAVACATSVFANARANRTSPQSNNKCTNNHNGTPNWGNRDWRVKEIARKKRSYKHIP